ncbi:UDP-N-acetylglucosamine transferase subunit ALG13 homolog [Physella acuta]|uniref:UDP-N-acetylglucosamine transferase subunit ALG13 homolog n=1 Tax=Physella acuta TaxID=109671 RepID=UPI0027DBB287|nr:UDP-N-acetylglucosamine transferase subunit ALG13 homolog [Physella acuta]
MMKQIKRLFVTVGTTQFDSLIKEVTSVPVLDVLANLGFTHVNLQIGRGTYEPTEIAETNITPCITYYRFKDSLVDDIAEADLVICHAGAGSIMDSLGAKKHVLVVINEELMGNHQSELAAKLAKDNYLYYCSVPLLYKSLPSYDFNLLQPFPPGEPHKFADFLDKTLGFV